MLQLLHSLVDSFDTKEEDVRKKMGEWPGLLDRLEELLTNVTEANKSAHDAIARGEETLRKAKEMLNRLKVSRHCTTLQFRLTEIRQNKNM